MGGEPVKGTTSHRHTEGKGGGGGHLKKKKKKKKKKMEEGVKEPFVGGPGGGVQGKESARGGGSEGKEERRTPRDKTESIVRDGGLQSLVKKKKDDRPGAGKRRCSRRGRGGVQQTAARGGKLFGVGGKRPFARMFKRAENWAGEGW